MKCGLSLTRSGFHSLLLVLTMQVFLAGCQSTPHDTELDAYKQIPTDQEDAGYASASVVAIMRLEDAKTSMPSNVSLTFENALKDVQHFARAQERAKLDSFQLGVNIGLSQRGLNTSQTSASQDSGGGNSNSAQTATQNINSTTPSNATSTTTDSTITSATTTNTKGQSVTNTDTRTVTRTQGVASSVTFVGGTPTAITNTSELSRTMTINPALAYQAADQLMKLTGMMRHQFDSIPHNTRSESVYIIQVKTSLQPYKPLMPLDAYVQLNVLPDLMDDAQRTPDALKNPPRLIPLAFGSEEYEFSSSGVSDNYLRGLSLGLTASAPGGAVNVGVQKMLSSLMRTYATDVNGLIVSTPMSPNTIQIRLGAMWQGNAERAMIPRSFNGFFAVVVNNANLKKATTGKENNGLRLSLIAKPFFRDPKTGRSLIGTAPSEIIEKVKREFCTFNLALKDDCVYNTGTETLQSHGASTQSVQIGDDWFAFLNRVRRNDMEVLACVGILKNKPGKDACYQNKDAAPLVKADDWATKVNKPVPGFVLEKFIGSLNGVGLKERSSYSVIVLPPFAEPIPQAATSKPAEKK